MKIILNGKEKTIHHSIHFLVDLLKQLDLMNQRIAIEINGEIIPRSLFATTPLNENDKIEIIKAVGGG